METHPDLFGGETPIAEKPRATKEKILDAWVRIAHYRLELSNPNCCGNCKFHTIQSGVGNIYHKCTKLGVTGSSASDVRVKRVCDFWSDRRAQ